MVAVLIGVLGILAGAVNWYLPGHASAAFMWACLIMGTIASYVAAVLKWGKIPAEYNDILLQSTLPPDYSLETCRPLWQGRPSTQAALFR